MINFAILIAVCAFLLLAGAFLVESHRKMAAMLALCGLAIFGCGVARDMIYHAPSVTIARLG
jgi:hypothetical protein